MSDDRIREYHSQAINVVALGKAINSVFRSTLELLEQVIPTASFFIAEGYRREMEDFKYVRLQLLEVLGMECSIHPSHPTARKGDLWWRARYSTEPTADYSMWWQAQNSVNSVAGNDPAEVQGQP